MSFQIHQAQRQTTGGVLPLAQVLGPLSHALDMTKGQVPGIVYGAPTLAPGWAKRWASPELPCGMGSWRWMNIGMGLANPRAERRRDPNSKQYRVAGADC